VSRIVGTRVATRRPTGSARAMELVRGVLAGSGPREFAIEFWDGTRLEAEGVERFRVFVRRPEAFAAFLDLHSDLALGEAYVFGDVDVGGDLEALFETGRRLLDQVDLSLVGKTRALMRLERIVASPRVARKVAARMRGGRSSVPRDGRAVRFHYDRSNEFFALFLDRRMVYSCGYFTSADDSLEVAQEHKLDLICRKLRLQPGDRMLDIGCGWGGLVMYAAERYGVDATGITVSGQQADHARRSIESAGLGDRCRVEVCDYREFRGSGFDKVVSVGMVEHVAPELLEEYFRRAFRALRPGGAMLNHGIAATNPDGRRSQFIRRYVFPDADLSPLDRTLEAARRAGLEVRDVDALREHYTLTLRHWVRRLEANHTAAVEATDEETYRVWRLYMAGAANAFDANRLGIFQTLFTKPDRDGKSGQPLTRSDWYRESQPPIRP
jgi:cyclopropane-fatty-acyl-phospholipid synthase